MNVLDFQKIKEMSLDCSTKEPRGRRGADDATFDTPYLE